MSPSSATESVSFPSIFPEVLTLSKYSFDITEAGGPSSLKAFSEVLVAIEYRDLSANKL